ncbi:hypothetical protein ATN83_1981 [Raoultella ornithinolytica]|jgi:hypothetical protein|nr:hypothetical protein ATN83_1981 [Raoultella ornithinolytica]
MEADDDFISLPPQNLSEISTIDMTFYTHHYAPALTLCAENVVLE